MSTDATAPSGLSRRIDEIQAGIDRTAARLSLPLQDAMLFRMLVLVGRELSALLDACLSGSDLNDSEFRTLMMLFSHPNGVASPSDLCRCVAQSPANMTRLADGLLRRQLITREHSDQDRRRMILRITPAGEALVRELMPHLIKRTRDLFDDIPEAQRHQFVCILKQICGRIDALAGEPAR